MFWSNVFLWDGSGGSVDELVEKVYRPAIRLLREDRIRQATIAVKANLLEKLDSRPTRDVLSDLRDLAVLHQIDLATVQDDSAGAEHFTENLRSELARIRAVVGEHAVLRGNVALGERNPFDRLQAYRELGFRWVLLDSRNVLGPYVDLLDDVIYEIGASGALYGIFVDRRATLLLQEATDRTSRQFQEHFPSRLDRKCYFVTVLTERDLSRASQHLWDLLDDLYSDPSVRSWRVSTLEELFQKRKRLESPVGLAASPSVE